MGDKLEMGKGERRRHASRAWPCPVCGSHERCSQAGDGLICCLGQHGPVVGFCYLGQAKRDERWGLYRQDGDPNLRANGGGRRNGSPFVARVTGDSKPAMDWDRKAAELALALTPERRAELAGILGLPEASLSALMLGYCMIGPHRDTEGRPIGPCWTFAETDAGGHIVGITCRYLDGAKKAWPGGKHGLHVADRWSERDGPVYCPEGPSDTLALAAIGLAVVGRPSNLGGADQLAELLNAVPADRPIVVLGEYDPKPDGRWPGKEGAAGTAAKLAGMLGRSVYWSMPPAGSKDVRAWVMAQQADPACADAWAELGPRLEDAIRAKWQEIKPDVEQATSAKPRFAAPILCSELRAADKSRKWLWHGCLAPGAITLFSALWKSGKTTLLAHLLRALDTGGDFCGLAVAPAKIIYVTEESETRWAERRDQLGIRDHVRFAVRPFMCKPRFLEWIEFIVYLRGLVAEAPADLIVFDTLSNLWPVRDENDAAGVQEALMPLHQLTATGAAILPIHHLRKGDGQEATGSRGSGALPAFVDTILELRRYGPGDRQDRRRVLTGYGRWDETPSEVVIELDADGSRYAAHGDRRDVAGKELRAEITALLPNEPPGKTADEICAEWPQETKPTKARFLEALRQGADAGDWKRQGEGKRGSAFTYWTPATP